MWVLRVCANPLALTREEISMHRPKRTRKSRPCSIRQVGIAVVTGSFAALAFAATAAADATDDYPIPHRMIVTTCTAEQILSAARDYAPVYYERYIIDKHNKPPEVQQAAIDNAHYFYSLSPADRRAYSEEMVTNFADPMTASWPNWAKIFFNNKGIAAKETDHCADYPPDDQSVWD